ncbi:unnamed protein product [marine sediment metagenome]|uniref:Uncharacterized protein n=1 Tax=marine sediment metagenome TaxID=412755 RepID=X1G9I1_9ZZZZ
MIILSHLFETKTLELINPLFRLRGDFIRKLKKNLIENFLLEIFRVKNKYGFF